MKRVVIVVVVLIVGLSVALAFRLRQLNAYKDAPAGGTGTIEGTEVNITARIPARIVDIHVREGDAVEKGKLEIELIRRAKKKQVVVSPVKRPPMEVAESAEQEIEPRDWKNFLNYMQEWKPGQDGRPAMKLRFWHPGVIYQQEGQGPAPLPGNVTIQINKQGGKPATIKLKRPSVLGSEIRSLARALKSGSSSCSR